MLRTTVHNMKTDEVNHRSFQAIPHKLNQLNWTTVRLKYFQSHERSAVSANAAAYLTVVQTETSGLSVSGVHFGVPCLLVILRAPMRYVLFTRNTSLRIRRPIGYACRSPSVFLINLGSHLVQNHFHVGSFLERIADEVGSCDIWSNKYLLKTARVNQPEAFNRVGGTPEGITIGFWLI